MLQTPKSEIQISHGMKSRDKTVVMSGVEGGGEESARRIRDLLREAVEG
ncbi:hypothetical protein IMZ48_33755 [Candidatus Bathyarchaeota archaeon]|nr:hypothetical protein [Candidatus Bathyarchaeota archaeon]